VNLIPSHQCLFVASDGQIDERSILFVGSKDTVSIGFSFVLICYLHTNVDDFILLHCYYYYLIVAVATAGTVLFVVICNDVDLFASKITQNYYSSRREAVRIDEQWLKIAQNYDSSRREAVRIDEQWLWNHDI